MKPRAFGDSSDSEPESAPVVRKKLKLPLRAIESTVHFAQEPKNNLIEDKSESEDDFELEEEAKVVVPPKATLETSILLSGSVGLAMMQKMGFKVGDTLGKAGTKAIIEPIAVTVKRDRLGLGGTTMKYREAPRVSIDEYRSHALKKHSETKNKQLVVKLQRFCYQSSGDDTKVFDGMNIKDVQVMWRSVALPKPNGRVLLFNEVEVQEADPDPEMEAFEALDVQEKLLKLMHVARGEYHYCPFCSTCYDDAEDMANTCPGPLEENHPC